MLKQNDGKGSHTSQQVKFEKVKDDLVGIEKTNGDYPSIEDEEEVLTQESSQKQDSIECRRP